MRGASLVAAAVQRARHPAYICRDLQNVIPVQDGTHPMHAAPGASAAAPWKTTARPRGDWRGLARESGQGWTRTWFCLNVAARPTEQTLANRKQNAPKHAGRADGLATSQAAGCKMSGCILHGSHTRDWSSHHLAASPGLHDEPAGGEVEPCGRRTHAFQPSASDLT